MAQIPPNAAASSLLCGGYLSKVFPNDEEDPPKGKGVLWAASLSLSTDVKEEEESKAEWRI